MRGRVALWLGVSLGGAALVLSLVGDLRDTIHSTGPLHVWYHLALFGTLGVLAIFSSRRATMRLLWTAVTMLLGLGVEYAENVRYAMPHMEWNDVLTDCGGVALGGLLALLFDVFTQRRHGS